MLGGLVPGQVAAAHQLGDERVVLGYGVHLAAAHEVGPRVADVSYLGCRLPLRAAEPYGDHRGAHPRELLVTAAGGQDPAVSLCYGGLERPVRTKLFENLHCEGACDLPRFEAADAVGDHEERLVLALADEQGVLVVLADLPGIGDAERLQFEEGQAATPRT